MGQFINEMWRTFGKPTKWDKALWRAFRKNWYLMLMSVKWNCHRIMAFWWHRKCQGRDKTFILKALDNHLWMVSFYWVFISNRLIIDMGIIIFLDGFDVLGNGLTHCIITELWHHCWTPGEPSILYFPPSEFWICFF